MTLTFNITDEQLTRIAKRGMAVMEDRASYTLDQVKTAFCAAFPVLLDSDLSSTEETIGAPPSARMRVFNEALGLPGVGVEILSLWES